MPDSFTMGTDPEVVFTTAAGRIIDASDYLPRAAIPAPLGCDGRATTKPDIGELRPDPGTPEEICNSISKILKEHHHLLPAEAYWRAGSFIADKAIGGHVHYGMQFENRYGIILDGVLTQLLACIEDPLQARRRRASGHYYGCLYSQSREAIRHPPHGFEYRTPASFIFSKPISLGVLALAKAIVWEEVNDGPFRLKKLKMNFVTAINVPDDKFLSADRDYFRDKLPTIWKLIRRYSFWKEPEGKKLWHYVANLRRLMMYDTWDNGKDILERWRILSRAPVPPAPLKVKTRLVIPAGGIQAREIWHELNNTFTMHTTTRREP